MKGNCQHSEQWLDEVVQQVELMCKEAGSYPDEYEAPSQKAVQRTKELLQEFQKAEKPKVALTQDGEFALTWLHYGDTFKAIVRCDGRVALFENKNSVDHDSFARRLSQVAAT